jgi:hypothetical protein
VRLTENPVFVTHKRLTLRAGMLAPTLIASLVGASLLAGLIAVLADRSGFHFTREQAGQAFYGWVVSIELAVMALGGFAHVWHRLSDDRKAGLWESHRVTPLTAGDLVAGYWFGAPLREAVMGGVLALAGLAIVLLSGLSLTLWFLTQLLIASTVCLVWLFAIVVGLALDRPLVPIILVVGLVLLQGTVLAAPELNITSFVIPVSTLVGLFGGNDLPSSWQAVPRVFGMAVHPVILTWLLQLALAFLMWRGATRHAANPFTAFFSRAESLALFSLLVGLQHGLIWSGKTAPQSAARYGDLTSTACPITGQDDAHILLMVTQVGTLVLATVMLALLSPLPERIRVAALRAGTVRLGTVYARSMVPMGLAFACVVALAYLTYWPHCHGESFGKPLAVTLMNLTALLVIVPALLDLCRVRFRRRSTGFFVLGLFALLLLPYILAGVFSSESIARWCLLSPGVMALAGARNHELDRLLAIASAHLVFAAALLLVWRHAWLRLLRAAQAPVHVRDPSSD